MAALKAALVAAVLSCVALFLLSSLLRQQPGLLRYVIAAVVSALVAGFYVWATNKDDRV